VGFFKRRSEARQESQTKTQAFELMAQYGARDMAVPVLWVCRQAGESPRNMQSVVPVIMNDDAPRALVARGIGRAAQLADEIQQIFGDACGEAERALFAAYDDDAEDDAAPEVYAKLVNLAALSEDERMVVSDAGTARGDVAHAAVIDGRDSGLADTSERDSDAQPTDADRLRARLANRNRNWDDRR
jgi:hypothetical protein